MRPLRTLCCSLLVSLAVPHAADARGAERSLRNGGIRPAADSRAAATAVDTALTVERVQVTALKQGLALRTRPVTASAFGLRELERRDVAAVKGLSGIVPNLFIPDYGSRMTSSIYVRGLGARIDQPVVGLTVDNVPLLSKDNYDFDLQDLARAEVLRGPQSTLYGRNTMGGVINLYTLSPLHYEGLRAGAEYGSGRSLRLRASLYRRLGERSGLSLGGHYRYGGGLFENLHTGRMCDWEHSGGVRVRFDTRPSPRLTLQNTLSLDLLRQGGYPYAYAGEAIEEAGQVLIRPGEIRYNDPSGYRRTTLVEGFTLRYDGPGYALSSVTSYQLGDDCMTLDQDFLPLSYFTLSQAKRDHALTEDLTLRSTGGGRYGWLVGAYGFWRRTRMEAPVTFYETGIERLIADKAEEYTGIRPRFESDRLRFDSRFTQPAFGAALYHESTLRAGAFTFTAGLRLDYEQTRLRYDALSDARAAFGDRTIEPFAERGTLRRSFTEVLPQAAVTWHINARNALFVSAAKGYKAGGFNTQMFSDVLQNGLMERMGVYWQRHYDVAEVVAYRPEKSWNYELGFHFASADGTLRGDAALFWIECRDQQLTVFPPGQTTGRMMTNAGRTRSRGGEFSLQALVARRVEVQVAYGYTQTLFRRFDTTEADAEGRPVAVSYRGRHVPYAPQHTLSLYAAWEIPARRLGLERIVPSLAARGAGRIWWDEANTLGQPFYVVADASLRFEARRWTLDLWCRNLSGTHYDVFRFRSMGHDFLQRGRPRTWGATLSLDIPKTRRL